MEGIVSSILQPLLTLKVSSANGTEAEIIALVDTGFSGYLTSPLKTIQDMALTFDRKESFTVGDNEDVLFALDTGAKVQWHESKKDIVVMMVEGESVLGVKLMKNSLLMVEAKPKE